MPQYLPTARPLQAACSSFSQTSSFLPDSRHLAAPSWAAAMARWRWMSSLVSFSECWAFATENIAVSANTARAGSIFFMNLMGLSWLQKFKHTDPVGLPGRQERRRQRHPQGQNRHTDQLDRP